MSLRPVLRSSRALSQKPCHNPAPARKNPPRPEGPRRVSRNQSRGLFRRFDQRTGDRHHGGTHAHLGAEEIDYCPNDERRDRWAGNIHLH